MRDETEKIINKESLTSLRIRIGRARFCSVMIRLWGKIPIGVLSLLLLVSLVFGIGLDIKYFIVALMIVFIVSPMILGLLYFYYGLGKYCYFNVTDHEIEISEERININMYFPEYSDSENDQNSDNSDSKTEKKVSVIIEKQLIRPYYVAKDYVIFPIGNRMVKGFMWVPDSAFETSEEFIEAIRSISAGEFKKDMKTDYGNCKEE